MRYRIGGGVLALVAIGASLAWTTPWASGASTTLPSGDLTVRESVSATSAVRGTTVTFSSYGVNLGPSASQLDVFIKATRGLNVPGMTCSTVSPDYPYCEFGVVKPNVTRKMTVQAQLTGSVGTYATMTVCTSNETLAVDSNSINDCSTSFIKITS